jgi:hypothetical protein
MGPRWPDENVSTLRIFSAQPPDALADLLNTLVATQNHRVVPAHHSDFKAPAPENFEGERKTVTERCSPISRDRWS